MYLLRIDNMPTSGYSSLILTPITEAFILIIHSAITASGDLHDLSIPSSLGSCYIYLSSLLSLDLDLVKSLLKINQGGFLQHDHHASRAIASN